MSGGGSPTPCVLGVDGGGTKTLCVLATLDGRELGRATSGPSNYQTIGAAATETVLSQTITAAARAAGPANDRPVPVPGSVRVSSGEAGSDGFKVRAICLAMAGVDRAADLAAVRGIVDRVIAQPIAGLRWAVDPEQVVIVNDAVASLVGGSGAKSGVVVVSGTGSIAFGMNAHGERQRAGGWGYVLGDEGSGYSIGLLGLRAVCRAHDGRAPATGLTGLILNAHGLDSPNDLISRAYGQWRVPDIAAIAPLVFRAAVDGDAVARLIVEDAAAELARAGQAVILALGMSSEQFSVVTAGGAWQGSPLLRERFTAAITRAAPRASVVSPRDEPVAGAVLLAREALGAVSLG